MIPVNHFLLNDRANYTYRDPGQMHEDVLRVCTRLGESYNQRNSAFVVVPSKTGTHLFYRTRNDLEQVQFAMRPGRYQFGIVYCALKDGPRPNLLGEQAIPVLSRELWKAGADLLSWKISWLDYPYRSNRVHFRTGGHFNILPTKIEGELEIFNTSTMADACVRAFGRKSGYGCGLLLLNSI